MSQHGGSEAEKQIKGNKGRNQEQEVKENMDAIGNTGLPIYLNFKYEINYEKRKNVI